ncbi:LPS-assembly protein LptD [Candidatus Rariloculus sp.]|uniref:LPS-assembly protein LptD n=1 Tax=Candidatus Rariloculus sp. TaxID=3101265 RepID=UPI003D0D0A48
MSLSNRLRILVFFVCLCAVRQGAAQGVCLLTAPEVPVTPLPPASGETDREPLVITAGRIDIAGGDTADFSEQVEIRYRDGSLSAERASYDRGSETVQIIGRATFRNSDLSVFAEGAELRTDDEQIFFDRAGFELLSRSARGSAEDLLLRNDNTVELSAVNFTTCPPERVAWELLAREILLDVDRGFGTARGVKLAFRGVPIMYAPYFTFPIDTRRKSGFLTPHFAERDRTGLDIGVPYYLNLAPNYDLTLEPRYLSKRGVQINGDFRYLTQSSTGQLSFEYLPDDSQIDRTRRYVNFAHETFFGRGWQLLTGIEEVSDDAYFEDLGDSLSITSQTHLNRYLDVGFYADNWSLRSRFQNYQTIDALIEAEDRPYERVPQLVFDGRWSGNLVGFESTTELVNFDRDIATTGWRFDSTQELSVLLARAGMYLTPAVAYRQTNYWLDNPEPGQARNMTRGLPIASIDTGLTFERPAGKTASWIQTLEPRMLYVHVPFEDQDRLPVFDTIVPDFNLVQLFRKYQFVGPDRITDTDQVSLGISTRLIDSATGKERLRATLGQTRYLQAQRVSLPNERPNDANASDYVAEMALRLSDTWNLDIGYQWNSETDATARAETRFEFRPRDDRLFGFGYRYRRGLLEQGDLSMVWPLGERWRAIARYSYSLLEEEPLEQFIGWEYEACCWRVRLVGRRYVSRRTGETDSAISIQLELKGLSQATSAPEDLLDRGILGYRSLAGSTVQ